MQKTSKLKEWYKDAGDVSLAWGRKVLWCTALQELEMLKRIMKTNQHTESPILLIWFFFLKYSKDTKYGSCINVPEPKNEWDLQDL